MGFLPLEGYSQQFFTSVTYRVKSINISGNHAFNTDELKDQLNLHTGKLSTFGVASEFNKRVLNLDRINLVAFYKQHGYINCTVLDSFHVVQENRVDVFLTINEGKQYRVGQIRVDGNVILSNEQVMRYFNEFKQGIPFNQYKFQDALDALELHYKNEGKPFVQIQYTYQIQGDLVNIDVTINEKQTVYIGSIQISGVHDVHPNVVRREILLKPDDIYNEKQLRESQRRIFETGLFADVNITPVPSESDSQLVTLQVHVREMDFRTIRFDIGAGQEKASSSGEPYTSLELSTEWLHRNLLSSGRRLSILAAGRININNPKDFLPKAEISYTEPWLWRWRVPTTLRIYYDYDLYSSSTTPIFQYGTDLTFLHTQRRLLTLRSTIRWQKTLLPQGTPLTEQIERNQERSIGFLFRRDTRQNFLYPKQGSVIEVSPKFFGGILGGDADFYRVEVSLSKYWRFPFNSTLAGRIKVGSLHAYNALTQRIPDYELFRLGGATSVRGFATDRLKTTIVNGKVIAVGDKVKLIGNLEWRFPIYKGFGAEIFLDAGQLWPDYSELDILGMRYSSGIGLTFATPLGPVRLDFGRKFGHLKSYEKRWVTTLALQYAF